MADLEGTVAVTGSFHFQIPKLRLIGIGGTPPFAA
jgi:hypothetical protein